MVYLTLTIAGCVFALLPPYIFYNKSAKKRGIVKYAVDALPTGIVFYDENGNNVLTNRKMYYIMRTFSGKCYRSGEEFYNDLCERALKTNGTVIINDTILRLRDGSSWMFARDTIDVNQKQYSIITASDVTDNVRIMHELEEKRNDLTEKSELIKENIGRLLVECEKEALAQARTRVHDLLGQRLTLLLRMLRYNNDPYDYSVLIDSCNSLNEELKSNEYQISPLDNLKALCLMFKSIGIDIEIKGCLHKNNSVNAVLFEIIREAVTNAVRHGLASRINVSFREEGDEFVMSICDNGLGCSETITEGLGISGMRKNATKIGGKLLVVCDGRFLLELRVAKPVV